MPTINSSRQPVPDHISQHWCSGGIFLSQVREGRFSHMRLRKPTGSLVLDRSIRDGDLARGIRALSCKSKQSKASPIVGIVPLRR